MLPSETAGDIDGQKQKGELRQFSSQCAGQGRRNQPLGGENDDVAVTSAPPLCLKMADRPLGPEQQQQVPSRRGLSTVTHQQPSALCHQMKPPDVNYSTGRLSLSELVRALGVFTGVGA